MRTRSKYSLTEIVRYRSVWMGIATILVILYHSRMHTPFRSLNRLKDTFYCGVDIFLFASGLGCYFSYARHRNPLSFLERRFLRLAPVYIPFIVVWGLFERLPIQVFLGNLFGVQGLIKFSKCFNWYIAGLLVCYFLTPFFFELLERIHKPVQILYVIVFLLLLSIPYWYDYNTVVATRLPIYFLGMYFAKRSQEDDGTPVSEKMLGGLWILSAAGCVLLWVFYRFFRNDLWTLGLHWYPFILITPGACVLISLAAGYMEKRRATKCLVSLVKKTGEYSFELYLVQIPLFDAYHSMINREQIVNSNLNNLLTIAVIVILSVLLRAATTGLKAVFRRLRRRASHSRGADA